MSLEPSSDKGICRIFASGKTCRFGNSCRYIHSKTNQNESVSGIYQDSSGGERQRRLCPQYEQTKFCKFGVKCRYLHRLAENRSDISVEKSAHSHGSLNDEPSYGPARDVHPDGSERPYFRFPLPNAKNNVNDQNKHASHPRQRRFLDDDKKYNSSRPNVKNYVNNVDLASEEAELARDVRKRNRYGPARSGRQPHQPASQLQQNSAPSRVEHEQLYDDVQSVEVDTIDSVENINGEATNRSEKNQNGRKQPRKRLCRYFRAGHCFMGSRCRFWHPSPDVGETKPDENSLNKPTSGRNEKQIFRKPTELSLESLTEEVAAKHRQTEIEQLLKRFPKAESITDDNENWSCDVKFVPSDPDWIFDVKDIMLNVSFPAKYPKQSMLVAVVEDEKMPGTLNSYIDRSMMDWISARFSELASREKTELMFRPFLKWLDRNLEDFFTEGLKQYRRELMAAAAGVQFISAADLRQRQQSSSDEGANPSNEDDDADGGDDDDDDDESTDDEDASADEFPPPQPSHVGEMPPDGSSDAQSQGIDAARRGTEVKLQKMQLADNAATLKAQKVKVILQCSRCKNKMEIVTPSGRNNQVSCGKCSQEMMMKFRPSLVHQMSSILGYMDLHNCTAFDLVLVDCIFEVGCFNCNHEMNLESLSVGEVKETFCHHCHKKMKIATESVRFQHLTPSDLIDNAQVHVLDVPKKKRVPKDPAIQEGRALPNEGTCKHYKKSFRWLRFPCCGKAYPCDVCHDDGEGDHEMAFANRMICGFCCKEQPYAAERPCVVCGANLTKKGTSHWEGGRGCRDVVKMSRDDKRKYANMGKTVSRKAEAQKNKTGKKTTKLRHA